MSQPKRVAAVLVVLLVGGFTVEANASNKHQVLIKHKNCMVDSEVLNVVQGDTITWTLDSDDSFMIKFVTGPPRSSEHTPCIEGDNVPVGGSASNPSCTIKTTMRKNDFGKYTYHVYDAPDHQCGDPSVVVQDGIYNGKPPLKKSGTKPSGNTGQGD